MFYTMKYTSIFYVKTNVEMLQEFDQFDCIHRNCQLDTAFKN
jgi:hypothetical protein